jgi:hypothetical protein
MWNVKTKVIRVIIGATRTISKSFRKYVTYQEMTKLRNYRKQPYWALHTYLESANVEIQWSQRRN